MTIPSTVDGNVLRVLKDGCVVLREDGQTVPRIWTKSKGWHEIPWWPKVNGDGLLVFDKAEMVLVVAELYDRDEAYVIIDSLILEWWNTAVRMGRLGFAET